VFVKCHGDDTGAHMGADGTAYGGNLYFTFVATQQLRAVGDIFVKECIGKSEAAILAHSSGRRSDAESMIN